jgi:hypothetical protein
MAAENLKLRALKSRYNAQKDNAFATLEVYLTNSAGIGEHPQIMDEIDKLIRSIADADGCLEVISKYIEIDTPVENQEPQA